VTQDEIISACESSPSDPPSDVIGDSLMTRSSLRPLPPPWLAAEQAVMVEAELRHMELCKKRKRNKSRMVWEGSAPP